MATLSARSRSFNNLLLCACKLDVAPDSTLTQLDGAEMLFLGAMNWHLLPWFLGDALHPFLQIIFLLPRSYTFERIFPCQKLATISWRKEYFTVAALSEDCRNMPSSCNVCSMRMSPIPHPHTPGNMWAARCSYVSNLIDPNLYICFAVRCSNTMLKESGVGFFNAILGMSGALGEAGLPSIGSTCRCGSLRLGQRQQVQMEVS